MLVSRDSPRLPSASGKSMTPISPTRFEAFVGGYMGPSYAVRLEAGEVVYERFTEGYELAEHVRITPAPQAWAAFLAVVDHFDVWSWQRSYSPVDAVVDGTMWSLTLEGTTRRIEARGANAYPNDFEEWCRAVSELVRGREFR